MSESFKSANAWTRDAIHEIETGETSDARQMLASALHLEPDYVPAWLWFAHLAYSDGERRYCYERALRVGPNETASQYLAALPAGRAVVPPELTDLEDAPLPAEFGGAPVEPQPGGRWARWVPLALAGLASLLLAAALGYRVFGWNEEPERIYLAFVADMTGPDAAYAREMERAARLYAGIANERGIVPGVDVEFLVFDDRGTEEGAVEAAEAIVADDRILGVVGHRTSSTSIAASTIYEDAGIPVITATATSDELTATNEWYFRTIFDNSSEGAFLAAYLRAVIDRDTAIIIAEDNAYGRSLAESFAAEFAKQDGAVAETLLLPADARASSEDVQTAVEAIAGAGDDVAVLVAANVQVAREVVLAIRNANLNPLIVGGDATGSDVFLQSFAGLPEEVSQPGYFTDGIYAVSPLITDSLTGETLSAYKLYLDAYGQAPTWRGLSTIDAGIALVQSLGSLAATSDLSDVPATRTALRDALRELDSPETELAGLLGPIFFEENRTTPRAMSMGIAEDGRFRSATIQLRLVNETGAPGSPAADVVESSEQTFARTRVVHTGVEISQIRDLNNSEQTFYADFFLWFKYSGDDDVVDLMFPNSDDVEQFTFTEVRQGMVGELNYRVYRVTGLFKSELDYHDFPFDTQTLQIKVQNSSLPATEVVYAVDIEFLREPMEDRLTSGAVSGASIVMVPNWRATSLEMHQENLGTNSNLGDPQLASSASGYEYSQLVIGTGIEREVERFLIKNLLPLVLIALITYISLFFSHDQTTERVSFGITGVLTGAVLLSGLGELLPDVGYTVAIEWAYYAFIGVSGLCILVALVGSRLYASRQLTELRALDLVARIAYPLSIVAIVGAYVYHYG